MEEKKYKIISIEKNNYSDLEIDYKAARIKELTWISTVAIGALILGIDIGLTDKVLEIFKDNSYALSMMPIYTTLAIIGVETFSLKELIRAVKEKHQIKKGNELYEQCEDIKKEGKSL